MVKISFLHLPSPQFSPEIAKTLFTQGFSEDICKLLSSVNRMNINCPIAHVAAKVMVFDSNMFVLGVNLGLLATLMQLSLSSQTLHLNSGFLGNNPNMAEISFSKLRNGMVSRMDEESAMYSLSVVLSAISVWSLLHQVIGQPAYIITKPVLDRTDSGLL